MAAAVGTDIDNFIREQKAKLALERQTLNEGDSNTNRSSGDALRKQWDKRNIRGAVLAVEETRPRTQDGGLPLTNRGSAQKQRDLATQRNQEYNSFLKQKETHKKVHLNRPVSPDDFVGLPMGDNQRNRKALDEQRRKEYQEYLQQKQEKKPEAESIGDENAKVYDYRQLAQGRRQTYDDMLAAKERKAKIAFTDEEIDNPSIIPFNRADEEREKKRLMAEERQRDYEEMKARLAKMHSRARLDPIESEQQHLPDLQYEKLREKERKQREYREMLEQQMAEKKKLHLEQYDASVKEAVARRPELDKEFSRPYREATNIHTVQFEKDKQGVPNLRLASTPPPNYPSHSQPSPRTHGRVLNAPDAGNYNNHGSHLDLEAIVRRAEEKNPGNRTWREPSQGKLLLVEQNDDKRKELAAERKREYNEFLKDSEHLSNRVWKEPSKEKLFPLGSYEEKRKLLGLQRKQEYNDYLSQLDAGSSRIWKEPLKEEPFPLGRYEETRQKLKQERQQEYIELLRSRGQNPDRESLAHQTDEYKASNFPGMNESDNAKLQKAQERKEEYNQFLREKNEERRAKFTENKDPNIEYSTSLPGLRESHSAKRRKEQLRNREYNQFLASKMLPGREDAKPPLAPRRGWATPYEDLLDTKRQQETQYRRTNDPGYNHPLDLDKKLSELDKELEAKKSRFRNEQLSQGALDSPTWLSPRGGPNNIQYADLQVQAEREEEKHDFEIQRPLPSLYDPSPAVPVTNSSRFASRKEVPRSEPSAFYATLPIGTDEPVKPGRPRAGLHESESSKRLQQAQYREELEKQIKEAEEARRRAKQEELSANFSPAQGIGTGVKSLDLRVDYSGYRNPEANKVTSVAMPSPGRNLQATVQPYHSKILDGLENFDQISPRSQVVLGRRRLEDFDKDFKFSGVRSSSLGSLAAPLTLSSARGGGIGILDSGFDSLLEPPRRTGLAPPPGLEYQPASYITQGIGLGQSSVDEAYNYYATRDPLDDNLAAGSRLNGGGMPAFGPTRARQGLATKEMPFAGGGDGGRSRVRFDDEGDRHPGKMDFPTDGDKKRQMQQKAQAYQEELRRQIEEKNRKKIQEKEERERYERKLEQEAKEYNPFGRGGGGAPMKDAKGNLVADLRSLRYTDDQFDSPRRGAPSYRSTRAPVASTLRDDLIGPPPVQTTAEGEQSHARGGHGIFGMPKTDAEKMVSEKYKEDLRRQIEERKMEEMRKREQERLEEEKEQRRVEEQQRRMQAEYEEERRKVRTKQEEARRKNEELARLAEERKKEAEQRKKEQEEVRSEAERREREAEMNARFANTERGKSPVIPTLRKKEENKDGEMRGKSPPVPAARTRTVDGNQSPSTSKQDNNSMPRVQSANVLNQLAVMRKQLQNERQRVENMLQSERNQPDVFDPRLVQRPPPAPVHKAEIDVFETALHRNAVAVRRTPADRANSLAMEDFAALKYKDDTDSRKEFRKLFPDQPSSADTLEAQQAALLRQQEQNLKSLRERREYDSGYPKSSLPPRSARTQLHTPQQLHSDSAFVDVTSLNYFPDDFDDIPSNRRNESARARRHDRRDSNPVANGHAFMDPFGSTTSLNVDRLSKKNEERLKRLREMQGDDVSLYDPDDVLDRFMSKQAHNRGFISGLDSDSVRGTGT